jgi:hypothetical protein
MQMVAIKIFYKKTLNNFQPKKNYTPFAHNIYNISSVRQMLYTIYSSKFNRENFNYTDELFINDFSMFLMSGFN